MHLYYLFFENSEWTNLDEALLAFVSEERRMKIRRYRFSKDKKHSLYASLLLSFACTDQYDLAFDEIDPIWPGSGKPVLRSHPEIHFSISHSGGCAAVAVSDAEIGLDAELIGKAPVNVLKRAFCPAEIRQIQSADDPDPEFFRIWTRKEAYGKYLGTGLSSQVLKTDTMLPEHDRHITEGVLTPGAAFSREEFLNLRKHADTGEMDAYSPALYYSVYGDAAAAELIPVSLNTLMEYYLLCI